jgi:small subunit ribosomal protein S21
MRTKKMSSDINDRHGLYVEVRNNDVTRALRKLKKLMNSEGMIKDMRKNEFYEKPSAVKRREKAQARKRWLKEQDKNKDNL